MDATFALFCLIPPLVFSEQLLNADGDAARHIRMGEYMLANGLRVNDPFSFTTPDEPIVLSEWGSRILYALVHGLAGLPGVTLLAGLLIGTSLALVVLFLVRRGVDPLLAYLVGIAAAVLGKVHWLARPHLFTLVGLALLLFLLEGAAKRRRLLWFIPLFMVWSNVHGGYFLGLLLIAAYALGAAAEAFLTIDGRTEWWSRSKWYGLGLGTALLGSFLNPEGPKALVHVLQLLSYTEATSATNEFMSPDFHELYGKLFIIVLGLTMASFAFVGQRPVLTRLAAVLLLLAGALVARRNIPLYGLVALPLLALHVDGAWRHIRWRRFRKVAHVFRTGEALGVPGRFAAVVLVVLIGLGTVRGSVAGIPLLPRTFDAEAFPVAAVEYARSADISGRLFNQFGWGGYIVYAWPEQKIFIDGMTDYFGRDVFRDYSTIAFLHHGWAERLAARSIDLALLPPKSSLAYQLRREAGWTAVYEDSVAVLLRKASASSSSR